MAWQPQTDPNWKPESSDSTGFAPRTDPELVPVRAYARKRRASGTLKAVGEALPAIGGGIGGTLGGIVGAGAGGIGAVPGGVVGAMGGGAAGAVARNALYTGLGLDASGMTSPPIEGAIQGGYEAFGPVPGKALRPVGRGLMRLAAKMTPEVAQVAIREGLDVSAKGAKRAMDLIGELSKDKRRGLVQAARKGWRQDTQALADEAYNRVLKQIENSAESETEIARLIDLRDEFVRSRAGKLNPVKLEKTRDSSSDVAKVIYERAEKSLPTDDAKIAVRVKWHAALADIAKDRLNLIPEVGMANRRLSEVIAVKDAIGTATQFGKGQSLVGRVVSRGVAPTVGFGAGMMAAPEQSTVRTRAAMGVAGALAGGAAASPHGLSLLALALSNPNLAKLIANTPRAAGWAGSSVMP